MRARPPRARRRGPGEQANSVHLFRPRQRIIASEQAGTPRYGGRPESRSDASAGEADGTGAV